MSVEETSKFNISGWKINSVATTDKKFVTAMSSRGKYEVRVYDVGSNPTDGIIKLTDNGGKENLTSVAIFYTGGSLDRTYVAAGGSSGTIYVWVLSEGTTPVKTLENQLGGVGRPIRSLMMDQYNLVSLFNNNTAILYNLNVENYKQIAPREDLAGAKHISMHGRRLVRVTETDKKDTDTIRLQTIPRRPGKDVDTVKSLTKQESVDSIAAGAKKFVTVHNNVIKLWDYDGNLEKELMINVRPTDVSMHNERIVACFGGTAKVWDDKGNELATLAVTGANKAAVHGNTIIVIGTNSAHIFECATAACPWKRVSDGLRPEEIPLYILKAVTPEVKVHPQYGKLRY